MVRRGGEDQNGKIIHTPEEWAEEQRDSGEVKRSVEADEQFSYHLERVTRKFKGVISAETPKFLSICSGSMTINRKTRCSAEMRNPQHRHRWGFRANLGVRLARLACRAHGAFAETEHVGA
jgi:hypothetical protein